jgi:hypothetical protein
MDHERAYSTIAFSTSTSAERLAARQSQGCRPRRHGQPAPPFDHAVSSDLQ